MKNQKITNAYKNAIGTMFLLAGAFFICSTLLSMRTVLADPIAPTSVASSQQNAGANTRSGTSRSMTKARGTSRSVTSRANAARSTASTTSRSNASRARSVKTRSVSVRNTNTPNQKTRSDTVRTRAVSSRRTAGTNTDNTTMRGVAARTSAQRVVARSATSPARVSMVGNGLRASSGSSVSVSYLTNKLYTGNYSNIIDSTTGMISADAYSTCLESYYTCMDEICTARSDTKGRCSCAGRATNFLAAENALEKANEELISLSGQLALLISTKGKDVSEAFKLTDAEKVMNCVSWKEVTDQYGQNSTETKDWCTSHGIYNNSSSTCNKPTYCDDNEIADGFSLDSLNGSSSDILASLKAWADAKDLAKQYTEDNTNDLISQYTTVSGVVNGLTGVTTTVDADKAALDGLANKWGYELFEYAHNNVCGRVLDSCFNGIYEACGTPPSGTDSAGNKIGKCANGASTSCPYNYNSAISVKTTGDGTGEVALNERGATGSTTSTSATCFGYTSTSGDPYSSLRGPVADARRSIMQKYLLDANAACDTYGTALKNTAQNINYQKIAAEQALRQKRMEFYNEEEETVRAEAIAAETNFNECISELWDCYNENSDQDGWTTARIKTYCAQVANVPHCYEQMVCNPLPLQYHAIIDKADSTACILDTHDRNKNTCRNLVTLYEILNGTKVSNQYLDASATDDYLENIIRGLTGDGTTRPADNIQSAELREACVIRALGCYTGASDYDPQTCLRKWTKSGGTNQSNNNTNGN